MRKSFRSLSDLQTSHIYDYVIKFIEQYKKTSFVLGDYDNTVIQLDHYNCYLERYAVYYYKKLIGHIELRPDLNTSCKQNSFFVYAHTSTADRTILDSIIHAVVKNHDFYLTPLDCRKLLKEYKVGEVDICSECGNIVGKYILTMFNGICPDCESDISKANEQPKTAGQ